MIRFQKVSPDKIDINLGNNERTKVLDTGASIETTIALINYKGCSIIKLDADHYKIKRTDEIKEFKHTQKRTDNLSSIARSMKKLRDIINYNVTDLTKVTWLTLTYAENMQDEDRLYDDFRKFIMRLRYYCKRYRRPHFEYIAVCEPQARGAWHMHVILIWDSEAPFISNGLMEDIWKHGFTKICSIHGNIDSLGYYLSAYLTDLPLEEALETKADLSKGVKSRNEKQFAKASRLNLYPPGINLFRCSKGIKRPQPIFMTKMEADLLLYSRKAVLQREIYTYIYDDSKKLNPFGFLSQHCYYDTRESAKIRFEYLRIYQNRKQYQYMYREMLDDMSFTAEIQEYYPDFFNEKYI